MSSLQPPPQLEPHTGHNGTTGSAGSSLSISSSGSSSYVSPIPQENIAEILFRILSKLTIYQSLPDTSNMVVSVREDVSMMDACTLFLPSTKRDLAATSAAEAGSSTDFNSTRSVALMMIEVVKDSINSRPVSEPQSPESKAKKLFNIAKSLRLSDFDTSSSSFSLLPDLIEEEAKKTTRPSHVDDAGDYLTIVDFLFFITFAFLPRSTQHVAQDISVSVWIDLKRAQAMKNGSDSWSRFCTETSLVSRASVSLSHGAKENTFYSGSTMNMSVSNLLNVATGSRDNLGEIIFAPRTGGSCLHAVSELLARPWQQSVPLSVSTEKGVTAIFGYTSLPQMMAHVAMNCSDPSLEPFFHTPINFEDLKSSLCVTTANSNTCTVADAFHLLVTEEEYYQHDKLILVDGENDEQAFDRLVLVDDLCEILSHRIHDSAFSLDSILLSDELDAIESRCANNVSILSREGDFPISLANLLQRLLLHSRSNCVLVLERDSQRPLATVSVRDVWNYVMTKNQPLT